MAMFTADYESYFLNERLSDVALVLEEEGGRKRKRQSVDGETDVITLPGHSMVLLGYSGFCRIKLENWSETSTAANCSAKHSIHITVPVGQLELGQRLIKCIYQKEPAVTYLDPAQLLQLLLLADRYEVPKVQAAVLNALLAVPAAGWTWQTVLDVLDLPISCAEQEGSKAVVAAATERLQQELGDLDAVWASERLQQQLLGLPFSALLQLLQSNDTRVVSEHTVVYTILQWYKQQPSAHRRIVQLKQLMQQVRMQHCSQLYIHTFMMQNEQVLKCFNPQQLAMASLCTSAAKTLHDGKCPLLQQYPAWTAAKRPMSNQPQLLKWQLPLEQLKTAVEQHLQDNEKRRMYSKYAVLQGQAMRMQCSIETANKELSKEAGDSSSRELCLGLRLGLSGSPSVYRNIKCSFTVTHASSPSGHRTHGPMDRGFGSDRTWGYHAMLCWTGMTSWNDVVSQLTQKGLVHIDQCLHFEVEVHSMQ